MEAQGYMCVACSLLYQFPHFSCGNCEQCNEHTQRCEHKYCGKCSGELGLCIQCGKEPTITEIDLKEIDKQIAQLNEPRKDPVYDDPILKKILGNQKKDPFEEQHRQFEITLLKDKRKLIDIKDKEELKTHLRY